MAGATVIAVAPVLMTPSERDVPAIRISSAAVELTAAVNPITAWVDVVGTALRNTSALGGDVLSDPLPVLRQVLSNQGGNVQTVLGAAGDTIQAAVKYVSPTNEFGLEAQLGKAFDDLRSGDLAGAVTTLNEALILGPVRPSDRRPWTA